jgi:hypothetical protein
MEAMVKIALAASFRFIFLVLIFIHLRDRNMETATETLPIRPVQIDVRSQRIIQQKRLWDGLNMLSQDILRKEGLDVQQQKLPQARLFYRVLINLFQQTQRHSSGPGKPYVLHLINNQILEMRNAQPIAQDPKASEEFLTLFNLVLDSFQLHFGMTFRLTEEIGFSLSEVVSKPLAIQPLNEELEDAFINIFKGVGLCLAFEESPLNATSSTRE